MSDPAEPSPLACAALAVPRYERIAAGLVAVAYVPMVVVPWIRWANPVRVLMAIGSETFTLIGDFVQTDYSAFSEWTHCLDLFLASLLCLSFLPLLQALCLVSGRRTPVRARAGWWVMVLQAGAFLAEFTRAYTLPESHEVTRVGQVIESLFPAYAAVIGLSAYVLARGALQRIDSAALPV